MQNHGLNDNGCTVVLEIEEIRMSEKEIRIGNLYGFNGGGFAGQVYDVSGIAPTLTSMQGGGRQPHIMLIENVDRSVIVAMRGRNVDNPSSRESGIPTEQRLEVNENGTSNCLTSVQKDNLVLNAEPIRMVRTERGKMVRKQYESGELKHGFNEYREAELKTDGVSNTISTVQKDTLLCESTEIPRLNIRQATKHGSIPIEIGGVLDGSFPSSKTRRGRVQDGGNVCPTITSQNNEIYRIELCESDIPGSVIICVPEVNSYYRIRIRKLTPRECGRLMDVSEDDIDSILSSVSNSQAYKQFGNSIVVNVICEMIKSLF